MEKLFVRSAVPFVQVCSGEEALETLRGLEQKYGPQLKVMLITDGNMPSMDGDELILKVREQIGDRLKVAKLLTGDPDGFRVRVQYIDCRVVSKATDIDLLFDRIRSFLSAGASHR
ncbi:MAG: hypothetical protein WCK01_04795 [Candidatus Uhrbacteria bacterium]